LLQEEHHPRGCWHLTIWNKQGALGSVAREKEAASLSLVEASEVPPLVLDSTSIQNEEGMDIAEEGKCLQLFISMSIYVI